MRTCVGLMALTAVLGGCTARYSVGREELERARQSQAPAVPARAPDGRPVWLTVEGIESELASSPVEVEVEEWHPGPALRTGGWILLGVGATAAFLAKREMDASLHDNRVDGRGMGAFFGLCFGVATGLTGGSLLVAGYLSDGPEVPPPPASNAYGLAR